MFLLFLKFNILYMCTGSKTSSYFDLSIFVMQLPEDGQLSDRNL